MRGGAVAARRAHNPKVGGSNPPPAIFLWRGSSVAEQGTHKPLVVSSNLTLATNVLTASPGRFLRLCAARPVRRAAFAREVKRGAKYILYPL